jgi:hypothetical protein
MALTEEQLRKWIADLKVSIANGGSDGYKTALAKAEAELAALLKTQDEARQAAAQASQRQSLVDNLRGLSKTGGSAYQTVMGQVNKGNARIGALAASGRGGLNAGVNASNAQALSSSSGRMQGEAAREATKAGARNALGQVIAQGQDANNAAIQQQIADLQAAYGQAPSQNPYLTAAATVGGLAQAGYQAYGNQEDDKKKK